MANDVDENYEPHPPASRKPGEILNIEVPTMVEAARHTEEPVTPALLSDIPI